MRMRKVEMYRHRLGNGLHSMLLMLVMAGLLGYLALILAGGEFAVTVMGAVLIVFWLNPLVPPAWILQLHRARPLRRRDAPELHLMLEALAERAGLAQVPRLYYLPNPVMNAFAVGERDNAAIALSDGLLRQLNLYELAGVLAHEMSHIRGNDIRVLTLADLSARVTRGLSMVGVFLFLLNLPLMLFTATHISWGPILVMLLAPVVSDLAQLALSRVREFQADLGSAELLGDARPLIAALVKMDRLGLNLVERWIFGDQKAEPSILRTHPTTRERVERLRSLDQERLGPPHADLKRWLPL